MTLIRNTQFLGNELILFALTSHVIAPEGTFYEKGLLSVYLVYCTCSKYQLDSKKGWQSMQKCEDYVTFYARSLLRTIFFALLCCNGNSVER